MILNSLSTPSNFKSILYIFGIFGFIYLGGSYIPHFCLFEELFNLKCSFCDLTYSLEQLFKGNFLDSFKINFLSYIIVFFFTMTYVLKRFKKLKELHFIEKIFTTLCVVQFLIKNI
jgi:hypothetical protein